MKGKVSIPSQSQCLVGDLDCRRPYRSGRLKFDTRLVRSLSLRFATVDVVARDHGSESIHRVSGQILITCNVSGKFITGTRIFSKISDS